MLRVSVPQLPLLTTALNQHQAELVKCKGYLFADKYIIELEDVPGLIDAKMKRQGETDKSRAPSTSSDDVNQRLNQKTQILDTDSKQYSISAGTQITQLIDQVMKNSTYITAQQTVAFDEVTKKIKNVILIILGDGKDKDYLREGFYIDKRDSNPVKSSDLINQEQNNDQKS